MSVGFYLILLRLVRKDPVKPKVADVFRGFRFFLPSFFSLLVLGVFPFVASLMVGLVPVWGQIAFLVLSLAVVPAINLLAFFFIGDQRMKTGKAVLKPLSLLGDKCFWCFAIVACATSLVGFFGLFFCFVGVFLTVPFAQLVIVVAYEQMFGAPPAPLLLLAAPRQDNCDEVELI